MSGQSTVRILGIEVSQQQVVLLLTIGMLALHPFAFATMSTEPFVLALPWWYWADVVVLAVIYLLIQVYVRETVQLEEAAGQGDQQSAGGDG